MRNATVILNGVEYTMALLGKNADAVAVPGGVLVFLDTTAARDGGGKIKTDGKIGQLTTVSDSGGFRLVAGMNAKVSVGAWEPRAAATGLMAKAAPIEAVSEHVKPIARIPGRK